MEWAYLVGFVISLATFVLGALGMRGRTNKEYTELLSAEAALLRVKFSDCERINRELRNENDWLRARVMRGGSSTGSTSEDE